MADSERFFPFRKDLEFLIILIKISLKIYFINQKKVTATKTLKWVNDMLSDHNFFRVHDSHLINLTPVGSIWDL